MSKELPQYNLTYRLETGSIHGLPIRFFIYDDAAGEDGEGDIVETDLRGFEEARGEITYERQTVFANGSNQICLTKMPRG